MQDFIDKIPQLPFRDLQLRRNLRLNNLEYRFECKKIFIEYKPTYINTSQIKLQSNSVNKIMNY